MQNMGLVYEYQMQFDKALNYLNNALEIQKEIGDKYNSAQTLTTIGSVYYDMKNQQKALDYFSQSLGIMKEINNRQGVADGLNNVAVIYEEMKNYVKAKLCYRQSLDLTREMKDKKGEAITLYNIGLIYKGEKDYENAVSYIDSATVIALKINALEPLKEYYSSLAEIYSEINDYKKSNEYLKLIAGVKDSLLNQDRNKQLANMGVKYESEKKELENKRLAAVNEKQKVITIGVTLGLFLVALLALLIFRGYREKQKANITLAEKNMVIETQKKVVEEKNKDITDSINYARRIQEAMLPDRKIKHELFPDAFVLLLPKDVVSGDFYWFGERDGKRVIAACDCTGHGVPGALMSMIGNAFLNQIILDGGETTPGPVLNELRDKIIKVLRQESQSETKDGMDIALCSFNHDFSSVQYAGAKNPLWVVRGNECIQITADRMPVGASGIFEHKSFTNHRWELKKNDVVYIFTDGYADQFGGPKGKKFKYKQLEETLIAIHTSPMHEQERMLERRFNEWKAENEQVDDVLLIGIRV